MSLYTFEAPRLYFCHTLSSFLITNPKKKTVLRENSQVKHARVKQAWNAKPETNAFFSFSRVPLSQSSRPSAHKQPAERLSLLAEYETRQGWNHFRSRVMGLLLRREWPAFQVLFVCEFGCQFAAISASLLGWTSDCFRGAGSV